MRTREFIKILEELGWPRIYLVDRAQFSSIDHDIGPKEWREGLYGVASDQAPVISIKESLTGRERRNVIHHEIAHHLFPHRPHWWIEAYAQKMARGGGTGEYCKKYNHSVDDLPVRERLVLISRRASARFNKRKRR